MPFRALSATHISASICCLLGPKRVNLLENEIILQARTLLRLDICVLSGIEIASRLPKSPKSAKKRAKKLPKIPQKSPKKLPKIPQKSPKNPPKIPQKVA